MGNVIIGGGGTDSLVGGKVSLAGTAKARGLQTVDPRLVQIIQRAAARSPYDVQIFSGQRAGPKGGSRHNSGNALDIALIDPNTGEVIPNYKSSTGFPIYADFAKVAREEQMAIAPDMANQFRWGGGFSDKDFDLMHFDFKPGGSMAYWTWQDGGKLTEAGAKAVPQFGPGYVYANGERYKAPPGQYASLWGRDPLQAQPQDAQSAIASLMAPSGGPSVPEPPTAAMGFAPTLPQMASFDGPPQAPAPPPGPPMPQPPPQWASNAGFPLAPIDEALTGQNAQDVLTGGPRMDPRRAPPSTGPIPADMGMMRSPADVLAAGPRIRPGGAPDASMVPDPTISPMRPAMGGPNDRRPQPPMPPPRAQGIPDPRIRPDPASLPPRGFPTAFGEQPPALMGGMSAAMGDAPSRVGDMSAAMGNAPPPDFTPASQPISTDPSFGVGYRVQRDADRMAAEQDARMAEFAGGMESDRIAAELEMRRREMEPFTPAYRAPETATMGDRFNAASPFPNAEQMFGLPAMNAPASFPGPDPRIGTAEAGSTTGEFFTPAPPMPQPLPDPMAGRFDDAFSPAAPGMIADLQGAFNRQQAPAPSSMTAQDGINSVFGAPPAAATPPNLAIPFAEVPGFGTPPAAASTAATPPMGLGTFNDRFSPPMPAPQPISMGDFNDRFAGGSVVNTPQPGQPGVVQGTMPTPAGAMDIRPPAQGGPPLPPQATPQAAPASPPRQTNPATERQRSGIVGRVLGGLLGGPIGALGGGLLGGGGGGFGFGTASFNPMGNSFSAPYMQSNGQMGSTKVQPVQSGNMQGTMWNRSNGNGSVGYVTDPFTGSMIYSGSGTTF